MPTSSWRCSPWESAPTSGSLAAFEADVRGELAGALAELAVALAREHGPQVARPDAEHREVEVVLDREAEEERDFW